MPGPDLAGVRQCEQPLVQRVEDAARALVLVDGQVGPAMSPTNSVSPVSTAHGSVAALGVDQREGRVLGAVAGRVDRAHA